LDRLFDASYAAIGTDMATRTLLAGLPVYTIALAYLIPYDAFKAAKYALNVVKHPIKSLSLDGLGKAINDTFSNVVPYKEKVPASVGVVSTLFNYAI